MAIIVDFTKEEMLQAVESAVSNAFRNQADKMEARMYTRKEVCDLCHITLPTFHAWVNNGTIQVEKIGRRTLVNAQSLDSAIKTKHIHTFKHQD